MAEAVARGITTPGAMPRVWVLYHNARGYLRQGLRVKASSRPAGVFMLAQDTVSRPDGEQSAPDEWIADTFAAPPMAVECDVPTPADDVVFLLRVVGLSDQEIADFTGTNRRTVAFWRTGTTPGTASAARLRALAEPHRRALAQDLGLLVSPAALAPLPPPREDVRRTYCYLQRPPSDEALAATVRALRGAGWTIRALAKAMGVAHATINRWGKGQSAPRSQVERLRALLDVPRP